MRSGWLVAIHRVCERLRMFIRKVSWSHDDQRKASKAKVEGSLRDIAQPMPMYVVWLSVGTVRELI